MRVKHICLASLTLLWSGVPTLVGTLYGQNIRGSIVGNVTDSSGAAVANAKILLTETNTGVDRASVANESGNFTYPNLPPGRYKLMAYGSGSFPISSK